MAGTSKILKDIDYLREEISDIVDELSKKRHAQFNIQGFIKRNYLEILSVALIIGIFTSLFSGRIMKFFKYILLFYATKKSISRLYNKL